MIAVLSIGAQVALAAVALAAPVVQRIAPPPSPPPGEWPRCATEGGKCYVPSGTLVRYGVGASWVYGTASGVFDCNNATFGDPAQGMRKSCYFSTPSLPADWTRCAVEGGRCNLADSQMVRYGAAGAWLYNTAGSTVVCTNATFSDPKPGWRKECFLGIPAPQGNWLRCALEGGKCNFVGKATVRYGSGDAWVSGSAADGIACTNAAFSDAKPGFRKECYFIGPASTGNWLRCAVEGGRCNFAGQATVRYGSGDAWVYGTASGGIACTNAAFSDPKPGTRKECYFVP